MKESILKYGIYPPYVRPWYISVKKTVGFNPTLKNLTYRKRFTLETGEFRYKSGISILALRCYKIDNGWHHSMLINTHFTNINPY